MASENANLMLRMVNIGAGGRACAALSLAICCLMAPQSQAADEQADWSLLTGYGASHPGWGETETRVETIDLVLRRSSVVVGDIGASWYRGYHGLLLEMPLHVLLVGGTMTGLNFLASYTFAAAKYQPYVFIGGGPVYVDADIPGMGSRWNGNYQIDHPTMGPLGPFYIVRVIPRDPERGCFELILN